MTECNECGEELPARRVAMGFELCVKCATEAEELRKKPSMIPASEIRTYKISRLTNEHYHNLMSLKSKKSLELYEEQKEARALYLKKD